MGSRWLTRARRWWRTAATVIAMGGMGLGLGAAWGMADVHAGPITVGVYNNPPKVFWDETTGQPAGFFPDILADIAQQEQWSIHYVPCDWAECLTALEAGELDLLMDVAYSQDRDRRFDFTREVVLSSWSVVVARRGVKLNSVLDLDGKRLGVLTAGIQYDALITTAREFDIQPELVGAQDYAELAHLLQTNQVDGVIVHRFYPIHEKLKGGVKTNILIKPTQLHFAVTNNSNEALLTALDQHLAAMKNNPNSIYYEAGKKWLNGVDIYRTNWPLLRQIIGVSSLILMGIIAFLLAYWNRSLRREVLQRIAAQEQLKHKVFHDGLTNLPNRNFVIRYLAQALAKVHDYHSPGFVLLFLDLDRFKVVNDSLGHLTGDKLLLEIAQRLKQVDQLVARLGGDEFVIIIDHTTDVEIATQTANSILQSLQSPCFLEGHEITVGASIGIVMGTTHYQTPDEIIRDADIAMYGAKAKGRNRYTIFDPAMQVKASQQMALENDFRNALKNQEFVLYYQPIVHLQSRQIVGFEALIRWYHPTQGLQSPTSFIPMAEETGLIIPLGWWILETACTQMANWLTQYPHLSNLTISVNISAAQLREPQWLQRFDQVLSQTGLSGKHLILEITETLLLKNIDIIISLLNQLQMRSVGISIDDFGTGYSSFSYLHQLPITSFKIDRLFIENLLSAHKHQNIVKTMLVLAHQLEVKVTAEGIETEAQMDLLTAMGCDLGQGFWFDRPLPADQALQRLLDSPETNGMPNRHG